MDTQPVIAALAALAQRTRLDVFRLLMKHEPDGVPAGELARGLATPHNTMSAHLGVLSRAGLIRSERKSRSIVYRADIDYFREVVTFLLRDCCDGHPELCASLLELARPAVSGGNPSAPGGSA